MATETTKLTYVEGAAASTPASGRAVIYAKADGLMYSKDDAGVETLMSGGASGSVATDTIWDAAGDLVQGTGANTAAKLGAGTAAMFLKSAGAAAANLWAFPPGHEYDYAQITSNVSITATGGTGVGDTDLIVSGAAVTYDGSTIVLVHFSIPRVDMESGGTACRFFLFVGTTLIGQMAVADAGSALYFAVPFNAYKRLTPTAASLTYSIRASTDVGTATAECGSGVGAANVPAFIRITKV